MRLQPVTYSDIPGADLVEQGLCDLTAGRETVEAALVSVGAVRLTRLGVDVPKALNDPEERLYVLLEAEHGDSTHEHYNAFVRRLVSFERALAHLHACNPTSSSAPH